MPNCNHCGSQLTASEMQDGFCPVCAEPLGRGEVSADEDDFSRRFGGGGTQTHSTPAEPYRTVRRSSSGVPLWLVLGGGFLFLLIVGGLIYFFTIYPRVEIYVDNGASESITVLIEGVEVETVPANGMKVVRCRSGVKQIQVKRGGKVVFDESPDLKNKKYVLNPEKLNRYWVRKVEYGIVPEIKLPNFLGGNTDTVQNIANEIELISPAAWFEVPDKCSFHLGEKIPEEIRIEGSKETRYAIRRMKKDDYDYILRMRKLPGDATQKQINRFNSMLDRLESQ